MHDDQQAWFDLNRAALRAAGEVARCEIVAALAEESARPAAWEAAQVARENERAAVAAVPGGAALDRLAALFGLSPFERRLLAAAAAAVFDSEFCAALRDKGRTAIDFGLALQALEGAHWTATLPGGPLRGWRILEPVGGAHLLAASLVLDERVLHALLGAEEPDPRVRQRARRLFPAGPAARADAEAARSLVSCWDDSTDQRVCPAALLRGGTVADRRAALCAAAEQFGAEAWVTESGALSGAEAAGWARLWEREALLRPRVLLIECTDPAGPGAEAVRIAEQIRGPVVLAGGAWPAGARPRRDVEIGAPTPADRVRWWTALLGESAGALNGTLERAALQFHLDAEQTFAAGRDALAGGAGVSAESFWLSCRRAARAGMDELAERIEPRAVRADLVLPEPQLRLLGAIVVAARQQYTVTESWGFAEKSVRGLGLAALFAGPSGTGKTMAAEVLAGELGLDLYRIDLSAVVSKYLGETEKNLRRVFDAADRTGAVLLFDEADALFGKRSEVRDSHDRYANIEVGYLLQRMEAYRGLAILTTNLRQSLDEAFQRRLRFVVNFPFPDPAARERIWRRILPDRAPRGDLRWAALARLNVPGGSIRNIALGAAVLAAEDGGAIEMKHLARAARTECLKLERVLAEAELAGWE